MSKFVKVPPEIAPAEGRLGVLLPGLGAVATTFIAGVRAAARGLGRPVGSLAEMGTIRLGKRTDDRSPLIKEFVPLAALEDLEFFAWDIHGQDAYSVAVQSGVLDERFLSPLREELEAIRPAPAVFDRNFVRNLKGPNVKTGATKRHLAEQLMEDIRTFQESSRVARLVMIWCASTEAYLDPTDAHRDLRAFEAALERNDPSISPSMIYAYAALRSGVPFANGAPNLTVDIPALQELAEEQRVPIAGKDFKTGQTLLKTVLAPAFKARMLGVRGWFSTNILGNLDGLVLDDPDSFRTKETSKLSVLDTILQPELYPSLYGQLYHKVRINYYPPRGDAKESWDNIDIFGWMDYPMQIKVNFLCRDSILAAPVVLDLALFLDLAQRTGMYGIQEWLSFYWKSPMAAQGLRPEHDLFIQLAKLKNTLRYIRGETLITHLGVDYYQDE